MFLHRKKPAGPEPFDREKLKPVIRCSICSGEQVFGFREIHTGGFHEIGLVKGAADLKGYMQRYGLTEEPERIY